MNQLARIWNSLGRTQQVSLILIPVLVGAAIFGLQKWKHDTGFRVLYSGLAPEDAAAVTQKIREAGIEFHLDETGAGVLVPSERLAEARLALAGAGLPRSGRIGFELFDRTNLGASDFAEQVNYRRALEGELERTVATLSEVEQARIHITFAKESVFLDNRQPSKATVVMRLRRGAQLSQPSVFAIANLVASAVDGLSPDGVAIIDSAGHLLNRPHAQGDGETQLAESNLEYRRQVESELLAKINSALTPLLGPDRFRASVSADCDFSSSEENDESVDATKSAVLTSQISEEATGGLSSGGTPGTASNLPNPAAKATPAGNGLHRHTENTTYAPTRSVKHIITPKGSVRRISTAVLLDQTVRWEGAGAKTRRTLVPASPEVLKGVHDIVAGITGFTEQRGDQITIETLPFENTLQSEPPLPPAAPVKPVPAGLLSKQWLTIGGTGVLVVLAGALIFVMSMKRKPAAAEDTAAAAITAGAGGAAPQNAQSEMEKQLAENAARQALLESEELNRIKLPESTRKTEVLVRHIRDSAIKDPVSVTNVLRSWITDPEAKRT
jgi:flagellar M-ring protein FliF